MATFTELEEKITELETALETEQQQVADAIGTLEATVADLISQQADGGTAETRQAAIDRVNAVIADLKSTVPPAE